MREARQVTVGTHRFFVADDQPTFWDRVEAGTWEPGTLRVLDSFLGPSTLFVDVGAWVGALSLYAAALGSEVVCLEADPTALDQLRRNLGVNPDLSARIRLVPRALSANGGPVTLGARRKPGDSMSSALLAGTGETWTSPGISPGELASELGGRSPDLVKLDIEGGEYSLLPELGPLLEGGAPLLLALHPDILEASGQADPASVARRALSGLAGRSAARVEAKELAPVSFDAVVGSGAAEWLLTASEAVAATASS